MKKVDHKPSKRIQTAKKLIDNKKLYPLEEALGLVKDTSTTKFDASVEVHIRLNIDPKKSDQQVRGSVALPNGTGKNIKIAVIATSGDKQKEAKTAGADMVGEKDIIDEIKAGKIGFDVLIATPDAMKNLAPIAKILGPRGLMPNPKDGTVTPNVADIIEKLKKGQVNYKSDDSGNLHAIVGKTSFTVDQLTGNYTALIESVKKAKPQSAKGIFIKSITVSSSMGPGVELAL